MNTLTGTVPLVRLALRRSRMMIMGWAYGLAAFAVATGYSFQHLYDTPQARMNFVAGIGGNGATRTMYGPVLVPDSPGGLTAWRVATVGGALVAVMCVLIVIRHTRAEEETGRLELVGACAVGRRAPLTAALLTAFLAAVALVAVTGLSLAAIGLPMAGSLTLAVAWLIPGGCFIAVAGVAAQLTPSPSRARGIALAGLGAAFAMRAAADAARLSWLRSLSPIGWSQELRAYGAERWWPVAAAVALTSVLAAVAYLLLGRRDLGSGLLPDRPGPATAAPSLRGSLGLAWRLQRGVLGAWLAWFAAYGALLGGIAASAGDLVNGDSGTRDMLLKLGRQNRIEDAYVAAVMGILGVLVAAYGIQTVLRLRAEETSGRAELLLATPARRLQWMAGHLAFTLLGTALALGVAGTAAGVVAGLRAHDLARQMARILGAALVQVPAVWATAAAAVLLFGVLPRATAAAWAVLAAFLLLGELGPAMKLGQAAMDLSPFTHVPKLPEAGVSLVPLLTLTAVAAVVAGFGLAGSRRRDIG